MAEPQHVTIVVPAFNERASIAAVVTSLIAAAPWREVLVVDDGSTDGTGDAAKTAGARVVTHPYNKGNGAAVKSAIRAASGEWLVIVDGDGQHRANDVARLVARLGEYDLVVADR
jgi:glycosyltransferase involved in cell wall biosynthesis